MAPNYNKLPQKAFYRNESTAVVESRAHDQDNLEYYTRNTFYFRLHRLALHSHPTLNILSFEMKHRLHKIENILTENSMDPNRAHFLHLLE